MGLPSLRALRASALSLGLFLTACGTASPCVMVVSGAFQETLFCTAQGQNVGGFPPNVTGEVELLSSPPGTAVIAWIAGPISIGTFTSSTTPFWAYVPSPSTLSWGDGLSATVDSFGGTATLTVTGLEFGPPGKTGLYRPHGSAEVTLPGSAEGGPTGPITVTATF